jgi:hypothetical protein
MSIPAYTGLKIFIKDITGCTLRTLLNHCIQEGKREAIKPNSTNKTFLGIRFPPKYSSSRYINSLSLEPKDPQTYEQGIIYEAQSGRCSS